jgi:hypothetical protein
MPSRPNTVTDNAVSPSAVTQTEESATFTTNPEEDRLLILALLAKNSKLQKKNNV